VHEYQFEYITKLHKSYPTRPKFSFAQFLEGIVTAKRNAAPLLTLHRFVLVLADSLVD
jgi:hypothetical protein